MRFFALLSLFALVASGNAAAVVQRATTTSNSSTPLYQAPNLSQIGQPAFGKANPNETDSVSNARCQRRLYKVPVEVTTTSFNTNKLHVIPRVNQSQITELYSQYAQSSANFTKAYVNGTQRVRDTFQISAVLCTPNQARQNRTNSLHLLVHGIGFDGSYWNFQGKGVAEKDYSYVYQAHQQGYSTLRIDRLGTGQSQRPVDGYNVVQGAVEVAILENIASRVRNSTDFGGKKWSKVALIGHSYGSVQSQRLSQIRPELIDALVLTGFSASTSGLGYYLTSTVYTQAGLVFDRFKDISKHWLVTATDYSNQLNFAYPPFVTKAANALARGTEQPVTQGAHFTIGTLGAPAQNYTKPVQVVLGDRDYIFAFGGAYVNGTNLASAAADALYPASTNKRGTILANTGHGINFHSNSNKAYQEILSFINSTGV